MAGATAPGECLWVRREQRRPEGKANVLGRQLRLEGFGGKAIVFLVDGTHMTSLMLFTASTISQAWKNDPRVSHKLNFGGSLTQYRGVDKDCTSSVSPPTPGFRNAVSRTPRFFLFYLPTPLLYH